LFHAAGANTSVDIHRMANLLQVSSAFGRAMEAVDRVGLCEQLYPSLLKLSASLSEAEIDAAIASSAEGYAFPTNLDTDPPVDGLAPLSQQALIKQSLQQGLPLEEFKRQLALRDDCRRA
jgi:ectoine hydroxylase-related dioxygenase (phytanoyl-CoA dioxygenase family)